MGWLIRGVLGGVVSGLHLLPPAAAIVPVLSKHWRQGQAVDGFATVAAAVTWGFLRLHVAAAAA